MANVKNYRKQGGDEWVIGGVLNILSGGMVRVAGGEANLNALARSVDFTISAGGSDVCEVELQVQDAAGDDLEEPALMVVWLSDDDGGVGLTATGASGTVQAKSGEGTDFGALTAKKALIVQTKADGSYTLEITDNADTGYYVAATLIGDSQVHVSRQLTASDYGNNG